MDNTEYSWANFPIEEEKLAKAAEFCHRDREKGEPGLIDKISWGLESDADCKPADMVYLYQSLDKEQRKIIDAFCVNLCGWSFATMVSEYVDEHEEVDDNE